MSWPEGFPCPVCKYPWKEGPPQGIEETNEGICENCESAFLWEYGPPKRITILKYENYTWREEIRNAS